VTQATGLGQHGQTLLRVEEGRFSRMRTDRQHQAIRKPRGLAHQVEMAIGGGIE